MEDSAFASISSLICGGSFLGIFAFMGIFQLVFYVLIILSYVLWIFMLIDVIKREENKFDSKSENQKVIWIVILAMAGTIGGIIYYFMIYRKLGPAKN